MKLAELELRTEEEPYNPFYISFSDLMVLLCAFFIMLLAMSKIDIGSFEKVRSGFTGSTENTLVELTETLGRIVEGDPGVPGVKVRLAADGVRLDLDTAALFESGQAVLKPYSLDPLTPLLAEIVQTPYGIDVEGHTDDRPLYRRHGDEIETNWSLSGRRASSVVHYLLNFGIPQQRMRIVGYASTQPKAAISGKSDDALERARSENRRVSLLIR